MPRRRTFDPGDWRSIARRLDEVVSAGCGEDAFAEVVKLVIAKLHTERARSTFAPASPSDLDALLAAACWRWPAVLVDAETRLDAPTIARCAAILRAVAVGEQQLTGLNALFQAIVSRSARGEKGQFFTPLAVVRDVVRRLQLRPGERVVDPACGVGGFLLEAVAQAPGCVPFGFDVDVRALPVARALLVVAGECPTHVRLADSLRPGGIEELAGEPFDVVLTNPPFAGDVGLDACAGYTLAQARPVERDVLFLERSLALLRPGGRFGIVVPDNQVGGSRLAFVRRWLLCAARLDAVVALDRGAFEPWTSQKACVLYGTKRERPLGEPAGDEAIELVTAGGVGARLRVQDLDGGWVLAPERYVARGAAGVGARLGDLVHVRSEVHRASSLPAGRPALVLDTSHAWEGVVLAQHAPVEVATIQSPKRVLEPGDVIISRLRSYLRQVAVVEDALFERAPGGNLVVASAELLVLRDGVIPAAALVPFLLSPGVQAVLAASESGGHHPRFQKDALAGLRVPPGVVDGARELAEEVRAASRQVAEGLARLREASRGVDERVEDQRPVGPGGAG